MEETTYLIYNSIITIIISAITGYCSSKMAYNRDIDRKIYDEREKVYIDSIKFIEKLKRNPQLVFNSSEFLIPFAEVKARLNLYASKEILSIISPLNDMICNISEKYFELFDSIGGRQIRENLLEYNDTTELELQQTEELYIENNKIDSLYVRNVFSKLLSQIRQELKTERN